MKWLHEHFYTPLANIPAVFIDGFLYFLIAIFGASIGILSEDDAYKYINEFVLYWLKFWSKVGLAGATALKMYRSTSYSVHLDEKAADKPAELLKKQKADEQEAKIAAIQNEVDAKKKQAEAEQAAKVVAVTDAAKINELKADVATKDP